MTGCQRKRLCVLFAYYFVPACLLRIDLINRLRLPSTPWSMIPPPRRWTETRSFKAIPGMTDEEKSQLQVSVRHPRCNIQCLSRGKCKYRGRLKVSGSSGLKVTRARSYSTPMGFCTYSNHFRRLCFESAVRMSSDELIAHCRSLYVS
jgi:hypothetical protein